MALQTPHRAATVVKATSIIVFIIPAYVIHSMAIFQIQKILSLGVENSERFRVNWRKLEKTRVIKRAFFKKINFIV